MNLLFDLQLMSLLQPILERVCSSGNENVPVQFYAELSSAVFDSLKVPTQ